MTRIDDSNTQEYKCFAYEVVRNKSPSIEQNFSNNGYLTPTFAPIPTELSSPNVENPFDVFQNFLHKFIYGENVERDDPSADILKIPTQVNYTDLLRHYVMGNYMHAEVYNNKSAVHLAPSEFIHRGYCQLNITKDFMQTAVNAFAILLYGTLDDLLRLPADYVLRSSRGISMMTIPREKLAAIWDVVRGSNRTVDISYETLEMYRPLFKYINGREMARLNLTDERILGYIGTHEGLDRHQVGVVASKYIEINSDWSKPKYLNIMNNLLCGVPMTFMRKLPVNTYLQLSHQVFFHIRACEPLQRRFYLAMMTRTQAMGKSYSWSAQDVFRLGLLLTEVDGRDLSAISPQALSGITSQVMLVMPPQSLQYLTEIQLQSIGPKPLNILARKLKGYQDEIQLNGVQITSNFANYIVLLHAMLSLNIYLINIYL